MSKAVQGIGWGISIFELQFSKGIKTRNTKRESKGLLGAAPFQCLCSIKTSLIWKRRDGGSCQTKMCLVNIEVDFGN